MPVVWGGILTTVSSAHGFYLNFSDPDTFGYINTTFTASAAMRMQSANRRTSSGASSIFNDAGDIYSTPTSLLTEISLRKGDYGIFSRISYTYDHAIMKKDCENCFRPTPSLALDGVPKDAQDVAGDKLRLLDLFVYGNWDLDDRRLNVRLGKQAINWGESDIIGGGISQMQNPADLSKATTPGTEIKETLMPQEALYAAFDLTETVTLEAYYVWNWRRSVFIPVGTMFSPTDLLGDGYHPDIAPGVSFAGEYNEPDGGQWGVAIRKVIDSWNSAELGLFWVRSHAFTPFFVASPKFAEAPAARGYKWAYAEDQDSYAISLGGELPGSLGMSFQAELNYRPDFYDTRQCRGGFGLIPGSVTSSKTGTAVFPGCEIENSDVTTFLAGVTKNFGSDYFYADKMNLVFNVQAQHINNLDSGDLTDLTNTLGTFKGVSALDGGITDFSWGYLGVMALEYNDVFWNLNVLPTLVWIHNVEGYEPGAAGGLVENQRTVRASLNFTYLSKASVELAYSHWIGTAGGNFDKDNASITFKYYF